MKTIKLDKFVIAGNVSSELEFLAFDINSGGYPYASGSMRNVYYSTLDAIQDLPQASSDYVRMKDPKVYQVVLTEVDTQSLTKDKVLVGSFVSSLTAQQKRLLKEML